MTEDEAKKKWCPKVRRTGNNGSAINRAYKGEGDDRNFFCIASDCMMWRWSFSGHRKGAPEGLCGLAGRPIL